jgi:hypothetical protein
MPVLEGDTIGDTVLEDLLRRDIPFLVGNHSQLKDLRQQQDTKILSIPPAGDGTSKPLIPCLAMCRLLPTSAAFT